MSISELINPDIDRVDAVSGPATGIPFLMFKSAEGGPAAEVEGEPITKAEDDAEDVAEEVADVDAPNIDGTNVPDEAIAAAEPGDAAWEAVDAAKARVAVAGLAALGKLVDELAKRESAEGDDYENVFDLQDAKSALDFALGTLARFSVTEQLEADDAAEDATAAARAMGIVKALHLEVHDGTAAPAAGEAAPADTTAAHEAPAAHEPAVEPTAKAAPAAPVPLGIMELLEELCSAVENLKDNETQGAAAESPADTEAPEAAAAEPVPVAAPAPVAPVAPAAHEAPAAPVTPAEHAAAPAAPADPAEKEKDPFAKSADDIFTERLQKALAAATEPLLKRIDTLERTPTNDGPLLSGVQPGQAVGTPMLRGQEEGAPAGGLITKSAGGVQTPQAGMDGLAAGLKNLYKRA